MIKIIDIPIFYTKIHLLLNEDYKKYGNETFEINIMDEYLDCFVYDVEPFTILMSINLEAENYNNLWIVHEAKHILDNINAYIKEYQMHSEKDAWLLEFIVKEITEAVDYYRNTMGKIYKKLEEKHTNNDKEAYIQWK